ncbi:uncharacterized protein LOC144452275 [Glandiceps talaboti]
MASTNEIAYTCDSGAIGTKKATELPQKAIAYAAKMEVAEETKGKPSKRNKRKSSEPRKAVRRELIVEHGEDENENIELDDDHDDAFGYSYDDAYNSISGNENNFNEEMVSLREYQQSQSFDMDELEDSLKGSGKAGRSYKSLSRARRVVANARERNRVHTISAAFEGLRRAVPSYSHNQKLSKLAILRIACSYILALARLADLDYSEEQADLSFAECVQACTFTLQAEGRSRRRKE